MYESLIVRYCSPTLAGIKTGNLFNFSFPCLEKLKSQTQDLNAILKTKGIRIRILKCSGNKALIYVYRPNKLSNDLLNNEARKFLKEAGYKTCDMSKCIDKLAKRLASRDDFPHEIGLFLGYPLHDVKGFIQNAGKNYKCVGCWKVYSDEAKAKKVFEKYKKCKDNYCKSFLTGLSLQQLTVAV